MAHLIEVAFRGNRKDFFRWDGENVPSLKSAIIVEADRGEDLGHVHSTGELAEVRCKGCPHGCGTAPPSRVAIRMATAADQLQFAEITAENESARQRAAERVKANGLVMKLTDAEWQWDRKKLTFYFTSDRRVDFRTLVRELASMFRTRIELKQIGVRDEAKRLSGIGRCGREYCSSSWLPDLRPVNLAVAKDQKLSLNPSQISGACGRLMCCLRYEHEFYVESRRRFPKEGRIVRTRVGDEKVLSCNIFHETITLRTAEGDTRVVSLADFKSELEAFGGALPIDRQMDEQTPFADERMTSETQEFMVAREAMPMIDILVQPSDEISLDNAEVLETITMLHDMDPDPAPVFVRTIETTAARAETPALAAPAERRDENAERVAARAEGAEQPEAEQPGVEQPAGEVRRKRRRGRRGGRRLRGADGRARENRNDGNTSTDDTSSDNDDDAGDDDDSNDSTTN